MKLDEFELMDEAAQAAMLIREGVLVAERSYKGFRIILYQVAHFYVEVYFHKRYDMVQGFRSFESTSSLDPYLASIDLSELAIC